MENISIFEYAYPEFKIKKPIRLIELFAGIGSQAMALRNIGADFEHHRVIEFDKYAIASYNAIHGTTFEPMDITQIRGGFRHNKHQRPLLYPYLLLPLPRLIHCRQSKGHGKG